MKDGRPRVGVVVAAIGVVFGDIGTSPLYTFQECFGEHGVEPTPANVLGVVSLVLWSITLVVTLKYLIVLMAADNRGEGGVMALLALLPERLREAPAGAVSVAVWLGIAGAALLFGDGIITPAISVLSALEGLHVAEVGIDGLVVPLTVAILIGLFAVQRFGTGRIGVLFGPVMVVWFVVIGLLGARGILRNPAILWAISPISGVQYFLAHGLPGVKVLGGVVLAVTGGEALYADMGHFGRGPIRVGWLALIYPALLLCYLGQGAVMLEHPELAQRSFYSLVDSRAAVLLLVALATPATIIASQALISSVFSLTHQAIRLGLFPRVRVLHTSAQEVGQIYVPQVNVALALGSIALVLGFQHSANLAAAFGLAVSGTMLITSLIWFGVARFAWRTPLSRALPLLGLFLLMDVPFFGANLVKFWDGGWIPVVIAALFVLLMGSWSSGRGLLAEHFARHGASLDALLSRITAEGRPRRPGTAVYMSASTENVPPVLTEVVRRFDVLHERVLLLTALTTPEPRVPEADRIAIIPLQDGFFRVVLRFGFMEEPAVPKYIALVLERLDAGPADQAVYFLGRENVLATPRGSMNPLLERVFAFTHRNAPSAIDHFDLPNAQVIEIGSRVEL